MAAMEQALGTPPDQMGLAILADQSLSLIYLPLMIVAVRFTDRFNAWAGARPIDLGPEEAAERRRRGQATQPAAGDERLTIRGAAGPTPSPRRRPRRWPICSS